MNRVSPPWFESPPPLPCSNPKSGRTGVLLLGLLTAGLGIPTVAQGAISCDREITANVVVFDQPTLFNRLGAQNPNWIMYALQRDVVDMTTLIPCSQTACTAGNVMLRPDKRPRPLVVRSVAGSCLTVNFTNYLTPVANPNNAQQGLGTPGTTPGGLPFPGLINNDQVASRFAGFHAQGVELRTEGGIANDASQVGANAAGSLVSSGQSTTYRFYTPHEGTFTVNSYGATVGSEGNAGNLGLGMFAQLNVQPKGAKLYRSQVTEEEMRLATVGTTEVGQPIIDYEALYPDLAPWNLEGKAGLPVLNMLTAAGELVHSDINAIIAGPCPDGSWKCTLGTANAPYPLERVGKNNPQLYNRLEAFREFSSIFHDEQTNAQVFPNWYSDPVLGYVLHGVPDAFMINYGSGGIGSEIIANRLRTGPMHDCTNCAYEEFFLSSQTVGDPAMLVDVPANLGIEACSPTNIAAGPADPNACWRDPNLANGPIQGNFALYQEDPSNVHHAYPNDAVKIRNIHAGAFEQHIFHLHNHQWLFNPNDDNSNYLDAQEIMPGSGHTYELANGGAGNRNNTTGDAIFHCHFYPHFAQGMWYHIRVHDVFEKGTVLEVSNADDPHDPTTGFHANPFDLRSGKPMAGARALPDGELPDGTPIPAIVPLPGKAMAYMPAKVSVRAVDRGNHSLLGGRTGPDGIPDSGQAVVNRASVAGPDQVLGTEDDLSPGYPFWLAGVDCGADADVTGACPQGIVGQRMPTPPLDMLTEAGATANGYNPNLAGGWDGGLPRHALLGYTAGGASLDTQNRLDFSKVIEMAQPVYFPETGTDLERVSMAYQAVRHRPSFAHNLNGTAGDLAPGTFMLNGAPPVPGGPYNDPCIDDFGTPLTAGVIGRFYDGDGVNDTNLPETLTTRGSSPFSSENPRVYKIANIQIDAVFNKVGYHYPQERIIATWEDVAPYVNKQRPPQPLVMRFNTLDCGKFLHTNLVPNEFELDDFQVRTPTDIIGQHIHLPKWDLTTNDGAANGWNYEDGALSPGAVVERIHAINAFNEVVEACRSGLGPCTLPAGTLPGQLGPIELADLEPVPTIDTGDPGSAVPPGTTQLTAQPHPFFGTGLGNEYLGARTVIQRLFQDPIVNVAGVDRGLGMTFSHDHYGPSTTQQIGLYSTIITEPAGSTWVHNDTGEELGIRHDGGPVHWAAAIVTPNAPIAGNTIASHTIRDHREFYFEFSDFQHAYEHGVYVAADTNGRPVKTQVIQPDPFNATVASAPALANTWQRAVNPAMKLKVATPFPDVVTVNPGCPGPAGGNDPSVPRPCAEAININHGSMLVINYRNEPVGLRVFDPNKIGPDGKRGAQADGPAGDLAYAFQTRTDRAIPELNTRYGLMPYPVRGGCDGINCGNLPGDPITPLMRVYERDDVKIKIQSGATEEQHQVAIHGLKWLSNGSGFGRAGNSGWRNFQSDGISEQFSLQVPINPDIQQRGARVDYLYATDSARDGWWSGVWGILRSYANQVSNLFVLPDNPRTVEPIVVTNRDEFTGVCPRVPGTTTPANLVRYDVTAVLANDVLPNNLGVTIPTNLGGDSNGDGVGDNAGGPLNPLGGTLVYNRRGTVVPDVLIPPEDGEPGGVIAGGAGPLNDPTAILYMRTNELVFDTACQQTGTCRTALGNPIGIRPRVPVEPLVLRARAGDCIQVTLRNALPASPLPDLAGHQELMWVVNRDLGTGVGADGQMHFFNNNLIRPSNYVGLAAQLVEMDVSRHAGVQVGTNRLDQLAPPGGQTVYRWYAGDLEHVFVGTQNGERQYRIVPRPVEYGASNLVSADRVKQPQKGLFGALVIEPQGATYPDTLAQLNAAGTAQRVPDNQGSGGAFRYTRAQVTVTSPEGEAGSGGTFREGLVIGHKIGNFRWRDGTAIVNVKQGELGREGAEDSGQGGFNYASEPPWFRFKLPPDAPFGNAGTPNSFGSLANAHRMYANNLTNGEPNRIPGIAGVSLPGDPVTPVIRTTVSPTNPVTDTRLYVLNGASTDRDGTFILHGHLWQRDPYVCTGNAQDPTVALPGRCAPDTPLVSMALGDNPQAKWMGSEEGMGHVYGHWPILVDAGGTDGVPGDYLFRDFSPSGNQIGQFGILRVQPPAAQP